MPGIGNRTELPQATSAVGCSCCSTGASAHPQRNSADAEYSVEGLTCGHCVETVQRATTAVEGVTAATVELVAGGTSRLLISGSADHVAIREAVSAAGYTISR